MSTNEDASMQAEVGALSAGEGGNPDQDGFTRSFNGGKRASYGVNHRMLREPPFAHDDQENRRAWLWRLVFNTFEDRVANPEKLDTRFAVHLSALLGLSALTDKSSAAGPETAINGFLEDLSPQEFIDYKMQR